MPDFNVPDSALVPTTEIYQIEELDIRIEGLKEFLVLLTQNVNSIALMMNMKDTGYYFPQEIVNSQYYFAATGNILGTASDPRPVYRTVVWWNQPLPNAATVAVPHGIQGITPLPTTFRFTRMYGCATDPNTPEFIPIPYVGERAGVAGIELWADQTNVFLSSTGNKSRFTSAFIVLEYVKES